MCWRRRWTGSCGGILRLAGGRGWGGWWWVSGDVVERVEDQASVAVADLVGCETADHFVDGVLYVRLAGGEREGEGLTPTAAPGWVLDGLAGGVVIVAEGFALEGGRGAAVTSFKDMGAEGADVLDDFDGLVHEYPLPGVLSCAKSSDEKA